MGSAPAPPEFRFFPMDHVLVSDYLNRKVRGEELPFDGYVIDIERNDLYIRKKPWEVLAVHAEYPDDKYVYFFTTTTTKEEGTSSTAAGGNSFGEWIVKNNGTCVPVEDPRYGNQIVGYKKTFLYENSEFPNYEWVITECRSLQPPKLPSMDYVVCKLEKIEVSDDEEASDIEMESDDDGPEIVLDVPSDDDGPEIVIDDEDLQEAATATATATAAPPA